MNLQIGGNKELMNEMPKNNDTESYFGLYSTTQTSSLLTVCLESVARSIFYSPRIQVICWTRQHIKVHYTA